MSILCSCFMWMTLRLESKHVYSSQCWNLSITSSGNRGENQKMTVEKNLTQHDIFSLFAALFLAFHPHEQPRSSDLPAGVPAAGLLQPGCGLWTAGSFVWHAHPVLHGCRGENYRSEHVTRDGRTWNASGNGCISNVCKCSASIQKKHPVQF